MEDADMRSGRMEESMSNDESYLLLFPFFTRFSPRYFYCSCFFRCLTVRRTFCPLSHFPLTA